MRLWTARLCGPVSDRGVRGPDAVANPHSWHHVPWPERWVSAQKPWERSEGERGAKPARRASCGLSSRKAKVHRNIAAGSQYHIMCRHEHCVAVLDQRFSALLEKPCGSIWHNENYIPAFKVFEVIMPTDGDIHACSGALFPGPWEMPKLVAQRGRPRVQRRKTAGEQFRKKQQARTGNGADDKRRQCSCCKAVGHTEARCPLKARFIIKKPGRT